jgi:predicted kinase
MLKIAQIRYAKFMNEQKQIRKTNSTSVDGASWFREKQHLENLLEEITGATYLSSDEYRLMLFKKPCFSQEEHDMLYATIDHNVLHLLEAGHDVIYDANLNRRVHREEKYDLAKRFNADVKFGG